MTTPADTVFNKAADHNRAESERIERETKARKAENDAEIVRLLTRAIALGFSMHTPGAIEAVRTAFHDCFATETEAAEAVDTYALGSNDDIEIDDHPLMSTGPEGVWVQAWVWLARAPAEDEDEDEDGDGDGDEDETEIPA